MREKISKTVSMEFNQFHIVLHDVQKGTSDEEILKLAKKKFIEVLIDDFPNFSYNISDGETLVLDDTRIGQTVVDTQGNIGIVFDITGGKYPIKVQLPSGVQAGYSTADLKMMKDPSRIKEAAFFRTENMRKGNEWLKGSCGYLKVEDKFIPVIISKVTKTNYHVYPISANADRFRYNLTLSQLVLLFDNVPNTGNIY